VSGGAVFLQAIREIVALELPQQAESDVVAVLQACRAGPLQLFYDAGREAGLSGSESAGRGASAFFCYAAAQLADDLADGECAYLESPVRTGPSVQFMLQTLFVVALERAALPFAVAGRAARDLVRGAAPQQLEVRTRRWTLERARLVAEGLAGLQFSAYFQILWHGTRLEATAEPIGRDFGFAAHVAADVQSRDPRFRGLAAGDRRALLALAQSALARAGAAELECLAPGLAWIGEVLGDSPCA
jgi:hypothetical protein